MTILFDNGEDCYGDFRVHDMVITPDGTRVYRSREDCEKGYTKHILT